MLLALKLTCSDYGFDCDFVAETDEISQMVDSFGRHMEEEHGIEYQKEALIQIILRKNGG